MTTPFSNSLTGAQGSLVRAQVKSPNFSIADQTGWAILKNGDAYFFSIVAQGTVTATAFIGTDFLISAAGAFFYSAAPGPGTLVMSITNAAGTDDGQGNAYLQGITLYSGLTGVWVAFNIFGSGFENAPIGFSIWTAATYAGPYSRGASFRSAGGAFTSSDIYGIGADDAPDTWNYVGEGTNPAFGTGWANTGGGWSQLAYRRLASPPNSVQILGTVTNSVAANTAAIFTLPAGYQPASAQAFSCMENPATSAVAKAIEVNDAGVVSMCSGNAGEGSYQIDAIVSLDL